MVQRLDQLTDNFNDNTVSANWTKEGTGAEILEQNQRFEISHTAAAEYNDIASTAAYNMTSSYALVQVVNAGNQTIPSHEAILGIRKDANNAFWFTASNKNLSAYKKVGGAQSQVGASVAYNSTTHAWWRLSESGGTIYWHTSPDGANWTQQWTLANPFAITSVNPYLQSGCWQAESVGSFAYFDNFNLPSVDSPSITHQYHFFNGSTFLGALSKEVVSLFEYSQDINSGSASMNVQVAISADVASQDVQAILDEAGNNILDESSNIIYEERRPDIVGAGAVIAENNIVKVYEISANNPTGLLVFNGWIETWNATIGSSDDTVTFTAVSRGVDLADFILAGSPYVADVSQTTSDTTDRQTPYPGEVIGQSFTVGAGVTNIAAIDLKLANSNSSIAQFYVIFESSVPASGFGSGTASLISTIPANSSAAVYRVTFATPITVTAGQVCFFYLYPYTGGGGASTFTVYYKNSNVYANGSEYTLAGVSPANFYPQTADLYFVTYSSAGATTVAFNSTDPTTMLTNSLDTYASQGGSVTYTAGTTTTATGLSVTYTFNLATMLDAINKFLELAPSDWYWFVDPATLLLYFLETVTTATHVFVRGQHIHGVIRFGGSVENVRNTVYFSGGDTGGGDNLFQTSVNTTAITSQGNRQRLQLLSDGRVTVSATGTLIMSNFLTEHASIEYVCSVTVSAYDYDITSIQLGETVTIVGNGNLLDHLLLQIVRLTRRGDNIELQLGKLLDRQSDVLKKALLDIDNLNTLNNPSTPS